MLENNSQLFTMLFLVASLQFCTGKQGINSIIAYQCTDDYAETLSPPVISPTNRMLRVCIAGASSAVDCQKVVETTITQGSNSIKESLVIAGKQQTAFADSVEIKRQNKMCIVSVLLADKYFIKSAGCKSASTASLQVAISGSVEIAPSNTTRDSSRGYHLRAESAEETDVLPFALSISLAPEENEQEPEKTVVKAYQCTSDYVEVIDPPIICPGFRMLRVCIAGVTSAVECREIVDTTVTQASKQISDRLVVSGQQQAALEDIIEITAKGGKCMIAVLLTDKYFIRSSSSTSLRVVMSGSVAVGTTATAASLGGLHLHAESERGTKVPFDIPVSLTSSADGRLSEEFESTPNEVVDAAASICSITAGVISVVIMLVACTEESSSRN